LREIGWQGANATLDTLLFDLDGTLLPLDLDRFMAAYFQALIPKVAAVIEAEAFVQHVWSTTHALMQNEDARYTNIEKFKQLFFAATKLQEADIWPAFEAFYKSDFDNLRRYTEPNDISREICRTAVEKGYQVVVATNPIFPAEAIQRRLAWAGVDDIPFSLVTTMEQMHFCKPNPKYFLEILDLVHRAPEQCIMFGNDVQEDGVAGKIGMDTYLVTDCLIDRGMGHLEFGHRGRLEDVRAFVNALPVLDSSVS